MNEKIFLPGIAIGAITLLMSVALLKNMNGTLLTAAVGTIAGIAGYTIKGVRDKWQ